MIWGISSVGRASALQVEGHEFESRILHSINYKYTNKSIRLKDLSMTLDLVSDNSVKNLFNENLSNFKSTWRYKGKIQGHETIFEALDIFLKRHDTESRKAILDFYKDYEKAKGDWNLIDKATFEHKPDGFYISGTDAVIALLILGYEVNDQRQVGATKASIDKVKRKVQQQKKRIERTYARSY